MTVEEFNEFFKSLNPTISRVGETSLMHFAHIDNFGEYLKREADFWRPYVNGEVSYIANRYAQLHNAFADLANQLATKQYDAARANLRSILDEIRAAPVNVVQSDSVLGKLIAAEYAENWQVASGMYAYFARKIDRNLLSNFDMFLGVLKAHWFRDGSRAIDATATSVVGKLENQVKSYDETFRAMFARAEGQIDDYKARNQEKAQAFDQTASERFSAFDAHFREQNDRFENLSKTYEEYLRLKGPARYWSELAKSYESKGYNWRNWAAAISGVFIGLLVAMLYNPPVLYELTQEFWTSKNIKGTIISAIVVSTFAYAIQFTVKLALSSFHLSRDAKERAQLTYFYLAMLKNGALQESERGVVMQSLFSRSDTGLLKNDAGPTMPANVMETLRPNKQGHP
ncbi:DUF6161 domain-containing protein [Turneriella parva]|uniref:DUF6161 domain-containing protein n=1 Tax=Turneriella parva (strain ATCC BAA-1111 / DSM 21527 / NCTC 11395 / H) TaxID=869212 RepID=I4B7Q5_TURPD|nr:DUF6161 domain-containing protein [Turneriella parva]AFM13312.1 hypothetical protein Turpa_2672 [Turneriella parva DSM 21527]